jgi:hypothetical protein
MEFVQYLPEATQGVVVQPIGSQGVLVVATDTQRGISRLDQVGSPGEWGGGVAGTARWGVGAGPRGARCLGQGALRDTGAPRAAPGLPRAHSKRPTPCPPGP